MGINYWGNFFSIYQEVHFCSTSQKPTLFGFLEQATPLWTGAINKSQIKIDSLCNSKSHSHEEPPFPPCRVVDPFL